MLQELMWLVEKSHRETPMVNILWMKMSSESKPEPFNEMGEVVLSLSEMMRLRDLSNEFEWQEFGFRFNSLDSNNFVSLFWGDKVGNRFKGLSKEEQGDLKEKLIEKLDEAIAPHEISGPDFILQNQL